MKDIPEEGHYITQPYHQINLDWGIENFFREIAVFRKIGLIGQMTTENKREKR